MNYMLQMMNQMNINNIQGKENMKIGYNNNEKEPKFLNIKVKTEDGKVINIQSKSNHEMKLVINKLCSKADCKKENYKFYVMREMKMAKKDLKVEDNGIEGENDYIFVSKKNAIDTYF